MKKKLQLIALPTDKVSSSIPMLLKGHISGQWQISSVNRPDFDEPVQPYHLSLLSDEEIKDGNWYFDQEFESIGLAKGTAINLAGGYYKIVAITNPEIIIDVMGPTIKVATQSLCTIPSSLIEYFVEKQGKVDSVIVEYDYAHTLHEDWERPRVTSSGEIIWSPIEKITRDEAKEIAKEIAKQIDMWFDKKYPE